MNRFLAAPLLLLLLAGCEAERAPAAPGTAATTPAGPAEPATPAAPATPASPARYDGYGDLRFGMSEAEATAAWDGVLEGDAGSEEMCHYRFPASAHPLSWLAFMFEDGRFVRYDVGNDDEVAPGGGRRGMDAGEIRALYPDRVQASPHKYVAGGKYLRVAAPGGDGFLVFETDASGKVTAWRAGLAPQVDYIERCS